ncbi:MAG: c-type cytochrome [Burkholderiales bacterium]|nr:c-type cytochrome [Burkholderiales bacterium]
MIRTLVIPAVVLVAGAAAAAALAAADEDVDGISVQCVDRDAYVQPIPSLDRRQLQAFQRGRRHFDKTWGAVTSLDFEWGLGPTFNATSCLECHVGGGRGRAPENGSQPLLSLLVRLSVPGEGPHGGPNPDHAYGGQFQTAGLAGPFPDFAYHTAPVPPEASLYIDWDEQLVAYADGEQVRLREPRLRIENLAFGALPEGAMFSLRIAQPLHGLGLLEAVADDTLHRIAALQKTQGLNGRVNVVRDDVNDRMSVGRFGWKANQPSLRQQIAMASLEDMGLTSRLYRAQNCPPVQTLCAAQTPGNDPELVATDWDELELWSRALAVPAPRDTGDARVQRGARLFEEAKCALCHVPQMRTAESFPPLPQLANRVIRPYTDLLLHDMGEGLADGRPDFRAGARDWRTPPLWGLGLSETVNGGSALLHDGRARNAAEAILWHGGEAQASREAFRTMHKADRDALLHFLNAI